MPWQAIRELKDGGVSYPKVEQLPPEVFVSYHLYFLVVFFNFPAQHDEEDIEACVDGEYQVDDDPVMVGESFGDLDGCSPTELRTKNPSMFQDIVRRCRSLCVKTFPCRTQSISSCNKA